MIKIKRSPTADTRTCDFANTTRATLLASSEQHIADVRAALKVFIDYLHRASSYHDYDKLSAIDHFHADFVTGFKQTGWWDNHRRIHRHHLEKLDGRPEDVNLLDVLEHVADCVMAGMARNGSVWPVELPNDLLQRAVTNTVELLKRQVEVDPEPIHPKVVENPYRYRTCPKCQKLMERQDERDDMGQRLRSDWFECSCGHREGA